MFYKDKNCNNFLNPVSKKKNDNSNYIKYNETTKKCQSIKKLSYN